MNDVFIYFCFHFFLLYYGFWLFVSDCIVLIGIYYICYYEPPRVDFYPNGGEKVF